MASCFSFCVPPPAHRLDFHSLDTSIRQRRRPARLIRFSWSFFYIFLTIFLIVLRPQTASARRAALCRRSQLLRCRHKG